MRILTYNIRHGQGIGGLLSLRRIAEVVSVLGPDVFVANEVVEWAPLFDQATRLASLTGTHVLFQRNTSYGPAPYGNAIFSRHELRLEADVKLPGRGEQRGCLIAQLEVDGRPVRVAATHLALGKESRAEQIATLARDLPRDLPLVLAGDTNCRSQELAPLLESLTEVASGPTYPSYWPQVAYDHLLFSREWTLVDSKVARSLASDHLPLYADLELRPLA